MTEMPVTWEQPDDELEDLIGPDTDLMDAGAGAAHTDGLLLGGRRGVTHRTGRTGVSRFWGPARAC